jgi:hypothetical protein
MKITIIEGPETDKRLQMVYQYLIKMYRKELQDKKGENTNEQNER